MLTMDQKQQILHHYRVDEDGLRDEVVGGMESELVPTNQAKLILPSLSSYINEKGDELISHPLFMVSGNG